MALEWLDEIERQASAYGPLEVRADEWAVRVTTADGRGLLVIEEDCGCGAVRGDDVRGVLDMAAAYTTDVPKLCRAVRELYRALSELVDLPWWSQMPYPIRADATVARVNARHVVERWGRGGE